jgi:hypothetical protein
MSKSRISDESPRVASIPLQQRVAPSRLEAPAQPIVSENPEMSPTGGLAPKHLAPRQGKAHEQRVARFLALAAHIDSLRRDPAAILLALDVQDDDPNVCAAFAALKQAWQKGDLLFQPAIEAYLAKSDMSSDYAMGTVKHVAQALTDIRTLAPTALALKRTHDAALSLLGAARKEVQTFKGATSLASLNDEALISAFLRHGAKDNEDARSDLERYRDPARRPELIEEMMADRHSSLARYDALISDARQQRAHDLYAPQGDHARLLARELMKHAALVPMAMRAMGVDLDTLEADESPRYPAEVNFLLAEAASLRRRDMLLAVGESAAISSGFLVLTRFAAKSSSLLPGVGVGMALASAGLIASAQAEALDDAVAFTFISGIVSGSIGAAGLFIDRRAIAQASTQGASSLLGWFGEYVSKHPPLIDAALGATTTAVRGEVRHAIAEGRYFDAATIMIGGIAAQAGLGAVARSLLRGLRLRNPGASQTKPITRDRTPPPPGPGGGKVTAKTTLQDRVNHHGAGTEKGNGMNDKYRPRPATEGLPPPSSRGSAARTSGVTPRSTKS